jgi:hypothetical protein
MIANEISSIATRAVPVPASSALLLKILIPREHGSWGMWLVPLLSGALVGARFASTHNSGNPALPVFWFLMASMSAFLVYQPLEVLLGLSLLRLHTRSERKLTVLWTFGCFGLGVVSLVHLMRAGRQGLLWLAALGAVCFAIRWLFGNKRPLRVSKQVLGALALTSTAAGSYYVATGAFNREGLLLWLAFWVFSATQIEFVQLCIRTANANSPAQKLGTGRAILLLHIFLVLAAVVATASGQAPLLFSTAFVPSLIRFVLWIRRPPQKINFRSLGFAELFQNLLFASITTLAFLWA